MKSRKEFARHLRKEQTSAEALFWEKVRNRRFLGLKFRRQVPIDKFFVDFLCEAEKLIIELDDSSHDDKREYDKQRTDILETYGYRVIRFLNADVYDDLDGILESLTRFVGYK